jgi:hypothetical protein
MFLDEWKFLAELYNYRVAILAQLFKLWDFYSSQVWGNQFEGDNHKLVKVLCI